MTLRKYKLLIFSLSIGIILTAIMGSYYWVQKTTILYHYSNASSDFIKMANEQLKNDNIKWNLSSPFSKAYIQDLNKVHSFSKKNNSLDKYSLLDVQGNVLYDSDSTVEKHPLAQTQLENLADQGLTISIPQLKWFGSQTEFTIESYQPISVDDNLQGYIFLRFNSPWLTNRYLFAYQWVVPLAILLSSIFILLIVIYLKRYSNVEEKIQTTQRMLERLFDSASDAIIVLDKNHRVQMVNKAFEKMTGIMAPNTGEPIICKKFLCCSLEGNTFKEENCPLIQSNGHTDDHFDFEMLNAQKEIIHASASVSILEHEGTGDRQTVMLIRDETNKNKEALQLDVLEEFEEILESPVKIEKMVSFITEKMKSFMNCDHLLIFSGSSYATRVLLSKENIHSNDKNRVKNGEDLIAHTYITQQIHEVTKDEKYISLPLIVNQNMVGALLLVYKENFLLDKKKKMLLKKISTNIAAIMKVYMLILETNEQRELNERIYKFGLTMQTKNEMDLDAEILHEIKEIVGFDFIAYRSQENHYTVWNTAVGNIWVMDEFQPEKDILDCTIKWGRSILIENVRERTTREFGLNNFTLIEKEQLVTVFSLPLIYNNKVLGSVLLGARSLNRLTDERKQLVKTLLNIIAVHIENKNLYSQIENDATILERKRISREIHDGLAQNIGFITIQLHRLKKLMEKNQISKAIQEIEIVKEAVDESYIDLRETIDQLSDLSGYKENLCGWLKRYSKEFEQTHHIKVTFEKSEMDKIRINENQQIQITRVIQELLNNVRKHAQASEIKVSISGGKNLFVQIEDNGVGFDILTLKKTKYSGHGLPIIEERIRSINGDIHINSKLNEGTKVDIVVPMVG